MLEWVKKNRIKLEEQH
jgi:hypothetical protein